MAIENSFLYYITNIEKLLPTWVLPIVGLDGRPISSSKNPGFSSGGTNNADHLNLTASK